MHSDNNLIPVGNFVMYLGKTKDIFKVKKIIGIYKLNIFNQETPENLTELSMLDIENLIEKGYIQLGYEEELDFYDFRVSEKIPETIPCVIIKDESNGIMGNFERVDYAYLLVPDNSSCRFSHNKKFYFTGDKIAKRDEVMDLKKNIFDADFIEKLNKKNNQKQKSHNFVMKIPFYRSFFNFELLESIHSSTLNSIVKYYDKNNKLQKTFEKITENF